MSDEQAKSSQADSEAQDTNTPDNEEEHKEPSLGPACLVVAILGLAMICIVCGFGSFFMFRDQHKIARKAIDTQLIPWIETSQLSDGDQASITSQLETLVPTITKEKMNSRQLTRLRNCLQDNPVLLWGGIELIQAQAAEAGLSPTEEETLKRVSDRLLRAAAERKIGRNDVEFTIQQCSVVRPKAQSLDVVTPLTAEQIREFMKRAEDIVEAREIPNEPYDKSASQAFRILLEDALTVPEDN